jgi:hypothetical protein
MEIIEEVLLARDSTIKIEAVTWSYGPIRSHSYKEEIDEDE